MKVFNLFGLIEHHQKILKGVIDGVDVASVTLGGPVPLSEQPEELGAAQEPLAVWLSPQNFQVRTAAKDWLTVWTPLRNLYYMEGTQPFASIAGRHHTGQHLPHFPPPLSPALAS